MALLTGKHECSRDSCPPNNVSGNKIRCFMCSKLFYGKCFGLDVSIYDAFAPNSPFEDGSVVQFICPGCLIKPKQPVSAPQTTIHDKLTEIGTTLINLVKDHEKTVSEVSKMADNAEKVTEKLQDVYTLGVETKNICVKVEKDVLNQSSVSMTSFSDIVRGNGGPSTNFTRAAKRPRIESGPSSAGNGGILMQNRPKPKIGTSEAIIGQVMPPLRGGVTGRKFDRSLWVSRFHVETTTDQIMDYVVSKTGCEDRTKFFCKKLVKRDADLTTLKFVSFKIDVLEEFFDGLSDPSIWPNYVLVREFFNEQNNEPIKVAVLGAQMELMDETGQSGTSNGAINEA